MGAKGHFLRHISCQNLLSVDDLSHDDVAYILGSAAMFEEKLKEADALDMLQGKILSTLFFEASTRTRLSFETAMHKLGGKVLSVDGSLSSIKKGESLSDMGRIISSYSDIMVMRHPESGSVKELASMSTVPVVNAGDGANQHPTQALLDLYTIVSEKEELAGLNIGFLGDLKYGRTVHSLARLLEDYDVNFVMISHPDLKMPKSLVNELNEMGHSVTEVQNIQEVIGDLDVLYVTRIQEERFPTKDEFERLKSEYQVNAALLKSAKDDLIVLHPLPRVQEIHPELDSDPRAKYFKQAKNGVYVRMALLLGMLM